MIFDETKVYTALNAAQLQPGCEVICADTIYDLKMAVANFTIPLNISKFVYNY